MAAAGRIRFHEYFTQEANPYSGAGNLLHQFRADPAITPASLLNEADSLFRYPLSFLLASDQHLPEVAVMPFSHGLPGMPDRKKYALLGDLSVSGLVPDMVEVTNFWFRLTSHVSVPTNDEMANQWLAAPAADILLPPPLAPGAGVVATQSRRSIPIPHEYISMIIVAQEQGLLSWRWLWANVGEPIRMDPGQLLPYGSFLDFLRVACTQRPPAVLGGGHLSPDAEMSIVVARVTSEVREQALHLATTFLPGLGAFGGMGMQLHQLQGQINQQGQAMLTQQAQAISPKSIQQKNPQRYQQLSRVCETLNETEFGAFWAVYPSMRAGEWLGALESTCDSIAAEIGAHPPVLSPALATDIGGGRFTSHIANNVTNGVSPFRLSTSLHPEAAARQLRNTTYMVVGLGTGVAQADATAMVLANNDLMLPTTSSQFRALLEGYYVLLLAIFGEFSRVVVNYKAHIYSQAHLLQSRLDLDFIDDRERRTAYLIVMTYIWRCTNEHLAGRLSGQVMSDPDYNEIGRELQKGRLLYLTVVPPDVLRQQEPESTRARGGGGVLPGPGVQVSAPGGTSSEDTKVRVERPNQNVNLKNAWAATQHAHIYGPQSPFHSLTARQNKMVIASDRPSVRICLPMALRGQCYDNCTGKHDTLSEAEVRRVAEAGNLTVT
jgi:hypothetical protein